MAKTTGLYVELPEETKRKAKSKAALYGVDLKDFVRIAIERFIIDIENERVEVKADLLVK